VSFPSKGTKAPDAYVLSLRWLTVRSYSVAALRQRLQRKGCTAEDIEQAVQRCLELGYLNDERYARELASSLMRRGNAVGVRLQHELKKKGIAEPLAAEVISRCNEEFDEAQLLAEVVQRRYARIDLTEIDQRQKQRIVNYLQRRGFSLAMILHYLKQVKDSHVKR